MTAAEQLDTVLADEHLPAGSKALYLQLAKAGGESEFELFSGNNADHPKDLKNYLNKLVGRKYIEVYRTTYRIA